MLSAYYMSRDDNPKILAQFQPSSLHPAHQGHFLQRHSLKQLTDSFPPPKKSNPSLSGLGQMPVQVSLIPPSRTRTFAGDWEVGGFMFHRS